MHTDDQDTLEGSEAVETVSQHPGQMGLGQIVLSEEQQSAVDNILAWRKSSPELEFTLGGYAGTGKTTVIRTIVEQLQRGGHPVTVAAFTGKAVNVLERKGIGAQTMHSLLYDANTLPNGGVSFTRKSRLDVRPALIIIDEASMVSTQLYNDLIYFKHKVLFVGDPGQLEPVGDNPNLMRTPRLVLQKIHRQAEGSGIITLANSIRTGGQLVAPIGGKGVTIRGKNLNISECLTFSQIICAKNRTRTALNQMARKFQRRPTNALVEGDKIIVLRNNERWAVYNGMILFVKQVHEENPDHWIVTLEDEVGKWYPSVPVWRTCYETDIGKEPKIPKYRNKADRYASDRELPYMVWTDFAYAITCHKSQGSEWPSVLLWDEWMPPSVWDMKRWRYTGITRAQENLTICI